MTTDADDWADKTEQQVLDAMLAAAPDLGWSAAALQRAGREAGLTAGEVDLLMPNGPRDLAALLAQRHDAEALQALANTDPRALRMRERIVNAVEARLEAAGQTPEATRRWSGFLTLPQNVPLGLRLAWDSADALWRWAGDTATDENHYSKRVILAGILLTALPMRLAHGRAAASLYVQARVGDVMTFETWKAKLPKNDLGAKLAQALGRMRYGQGA
jgi:ubiquinone biosynthesis protein COQ9